MIWMQCLKFFGHHMLHASHMPVWLQMNSFISHTIQPNAGWNKSALNIRSARNTCTKQWITKGKDKQLVQLMRFNWMSWNAFLYATRLPLHARLTHTYIHSFVHSFDLFVVICLLHKNCCMMQVLSAYVRRFDGVQRNMPSNSLAKSVGRFGWKICVRADCSSKLRNHIEINGLSLERLLKGVRVRNSMHHSHCVSLFIWMLQAAAGSTARVFADFVYISHCACLHFYKSIVCFDFHLGGGRRWWCLQVATHHSENEFAANENVQTISFSAKSDGIKNELYKCIGHVQTKWISSW